MGLELRDIHKHFGAVRANDGISLSIGTGSIHGLLGENGAGKSTLMKILSGFYTADSGEVVLDGRRLRLGSPGAAIAAGIGMLHQDPLVFTPMSTLENFLLGSPGPMGLDRARVRDSVTELRDRFGFAFDLDTPVRTLSVGERQQLEITRLLWLGARVLILDEPTTGISADHRELLFTTLRELAAEGMSVIFVSHKLEEVEELCEGVTVLRDGRVTGARTMPVPAAELVALMFGQEVQLTSRGDVALGETLLEVRHASIGERLARVEGVSLSLRAGEVVGLAGMEGSGQRTLLHALCGLASPSSGSIAFRGADATRSEYRDLLDRGVQYLPAGRLEEGLVEGLTIAEHLVLADRRGRGMLIRRDAARERADRAIADFSIRGSASSPVEALSGGNQQRLLLAMLPDDIALLLMEHPTRGLDIESADFVWRQLLARRERGTAIVFASADLDELLRYSDRILVFFSGRVLAELEAGRSSVDEIGHLIGGRTTGTHSGALA